MLDAGQHLLGMINRVLDLSEIEAERVELHLAEIDPREVTRACLDLVRPAATAKSLTLGMDVALDTPERLTTDKTRLRQVLVNLLGNATKFTAHGTVTLRLRSAAEANKLRIEVVDTGPGIPEEQRHRLFQSFERLGAKADGTIEGTGLGLALSARTRDDPGRLSGSRTQSWGWQRVLARAAACGTGHHSAQDGDERAASPEPAGALARAGGG